MWNFDVCLAALTSLLFIKIQWNGLLRTNGVDIIDTGHHVMSHPTVIKTLNIYKKYKSIKDFLKYCSLLDLCKRWQMGYFKQECHSIKQYIITWLLAKWQNFMLYVTMATGYERFPPNLSWRYAKNIWFLVKIRPI